MITIYQTQFKNFVIKAEFEQVDSLWAEYSIGFDAVVASELVTIDKLSDVMNRLAAVFMDLGLLDLVVTDAKSGNGLRFIKEKEKPPKKTRAV